MTEPEGRERSTPTLDTKSSLIVGGMVFVLAIFAYVVIVGSGDMRSDTVNTTVDRANSNGTRSIEPDDGTTDGN